MREIRLYSDQSLEEGGSVQLEAGAAHHLVKVLRAQVGDTITLFNGTGLDWQCSISALEKRAVTVSVGKRFKPQHRITAGDPIGFMPQQRRPVRLGNPEGYRSWRNKYHALI